MIAAANAKLSGQAVTTQPGSGLGLCGAAPQQRSCKCTINLNPPPARPDPWTYDKATGQIAQFTEWQSAPAAQPPVFWIPNSIDLYSSFPPNSLPPNPSSSVNVTVGNNSNIQAVNALVAFSIAYMGIGRVKVPVANQYVALGPQQNVALSFAVPTNFLTETVTAGGIVTQVPQQWLGVYIDIVHPYDQNVLNNHAISMWQGFDLTAQGAGAVYSPAFRVVNEFSFQPQQITLTVIPAAGVALLPPAVAPILVAPGAEKYVGCNLQLPAVINPGTYLTTVATVVGTDANNNFLGGITLVGSVHP